MTNEKCDNMNNSNIMTRAQFHSLRNAMRSKSFGKILSDYADEISDPASRPELHEYISQLAKQGEVPEGTEVVFMKKKVVVKLFLRLASRKFNYLYLNICTSPRLQDSEYNHDTNSLRLTYAISSLRADKEQDQVTLCYSVDIVVSSSIFNVPKEKLSCIIDSITEAAISSVKESRFGSSNDRLSADYRIMPNEFQGPSDPLPLPIKFIILKPQEEKILYDKDQNIMTERDLISLNSDMNHASSNTFQAKSAKVESELIK